MVLRCLYNSPCYKSTIFQKAGLVSMLIVVQIGYGIYPVVVKAGIQQNNMDPFVFLFLKDITTLPLLVIFAMIVDGRKNIKWRCKDVIIFIGLGFTSVFSGPILFYFGVYFACPSAGAIIQPAIPAVTLLFAFFWGIEKLPFSKTTTYIKLLGILLSVGGAVVAALAGNPNPPEEDWPIILLGYTLLLGSIFSTSLYFLFLKKWIFKESIKRYPPLTTAACAYGMGMVFVSSIFIPYGILKSTSFTSLTVELVYPLIYATLSSALCYTLATYATNLTSPTLVTAFWPLQAIFTCASSWIVTSDSPVPPQYAGFGLIIVGTVVVCGGKFSEQKENKDILINNITQADSYSKAKRSMLLGENEEIYDSGAKI